MAFPKGEVPNSEPMLENNFESEKYRKIQQILKQIETSLDTAKTRALFIAPDQTSRNFLSFSPEEKLELKTLVHTLKVLLSQLEGIEDYILEATDNREGTPRSNITRDVSILISESMTISSIFETLKTLESEQRKKQYVEEPTIKNMLLNFYFGCLAISRARIVE